ncbi:MAG: FAD-dependent oxidoreductase [Verrucomicrobiota bacterium]
MKLKSKSLILLATGFAVVGLLSADDHHEYDVIVYGGTSAAVTAAVQVKEMGKTVAIVCPDTILGGLSSGGLGWTDTGNKAVIGGLSRDFYHRIWKEYDRDESWDWQDLADYGNKGQGTPAIDGDKKTMWIFEPSVAEKVFEDYISEFEIPVFRDEWLDREEGVKMSGSDIVAITTLSGKTFRGKMFLDTTYEGDLIAAAGVDYHVGREANAEFEENWNGVQTGVDHHNHHFQLLNSPVSPYRIPGDPESGLLPRISPDPPGEYGSADARVQAYCFRMCLTDHPENRIPFTAPDGYDPDQYELLIRCFEAGWGMQVFNKFDPIPNRKTDTNNHGPFSFDNIGYNWDYPEASYEERREIIAEHETYQKGLLYFIATDPRVPADVQAEMNRWGLPKDEFQATGGWSHQLYIREARRMKGAFVMTENELRKVKPTPDSVGMGSYTIDSHNVQRHIDENGHVQNEGDIGVSTRGPYEIAYGALIPRAEQCTNLLVPVCVSSTHIAFGSIRMEPVFMILGQSAATAAVMAIENDKSVQEVDYDTLRERLLADGQILEFDGPVGSKGIELSDLDGIVVDDLKAEREGIWRSSASVGGYVAFGYQHDDNAGKGTSSATFRTQLPASGQYQVAIAYSPNGNRASNVPISVTHSEGDSIVLLDQRAKPETAPFWTIGTFTFDAEEEAVVKISNKDTDGHVIIDAVQWLPVK